MDPKVTLENTESSCQLLWNDVSGGMEMDQLCRFSPIIYANSCFYRLPAQVYNTSLGKIGAAICWENYMPMYRMTLYNKGIEIYLACTVDDRDVWLSTMRTIALEGRCFVISAAQFLKSSDYPENHPIREKHGLDKVLIRGGSCAVDPLGTVLVQPDFTKELIHYVDVNLSQIARAKMDLDTVGHYSRPEVFQLIVNERSFEPVVRRTD
ncbi:unnamed protein product [Strongylus vulgaris]|uniref:CN hydrolase domain-containing protein n=1 Tax=Strongylus vulgaris TaxID=40348 RepID=A0A3P7IKM0_STRVU|nr:unnamed protein product [Strongylus vulgaris]